MSKSDEEMKKRRAVSMDSSLAEEDGEMIKRQKKEKTEKKKKNDEQDESKGMNAEEFRKAHDIKIIGDRYGSERVDCPEPVQTFDRVKDVFGERLTNALLAQGYTSPSPIQAQAWPLALTGQDIVAVAKTGSGKTCGFLLPILARMIQRNATGTVPQRRLGWGESAKPKSLVIAPTRELVQQIAVEANKFAPAAGSRVVVIYGGSAKGDQVRELKWGCDILAATPGRLIDFGSGDDSRGLPPAVDLSEVSYLVLDEADRMLDMGFEKDIRTIVSWCPDTGKPSEGGGAEGPQAGTKRQTLFFTATWPKSVQGVARSLTSSDAVQVRIGQGAGGDKLTANKNVTQTVIIVEEHEKRAKLKEILDANLKEGETGVIFAGTKKNCDDLTWELKEQNLWAKSIHSGKDQESREYSLDQFRKLTASGTRRGVLVATDVAARGLDVPGVSLVVVYDFGGRGKMASKDQAVESYVHRIGRTGRAGKQGRAITFFTPEERGARELCELLRGAEMEIPERLESMAGREPGGKGGKGSKGKGKGGKGKGGKGKGGGWGGWGSGGYRQW